MVKVTKSYETTVCDKCRREGAVPCVICGIDICNEHGNIPRGFADTLGFVFLNTSYDSSVRGFLCCKEHIEEIREYFVRHYDVSFKETDNGSC